MTILTPEVSARIAESVRKAPEFTAEQRRRLGRLWSAANYENVRRPTRAAA